MENERMWCLFNRFDNLNRSVNCAELMRHDGTRRSWRPTRREMRHRVTRSLPTLYCSSFTPENKVNAAGLGARGCWTLHPFTRFRIGLVWPLPGAVLQARPPPGAVSNHEVDRGFEPEPLAPEASQHSAIPPTWISG